MPDLNGIWPYLLSGCLGLLLILNILLLIRDGRRERAARLTVKRLQALDHEMEILRTQMDQQPGREELFAVLQAHFSHLDEGIRGQNGLLATRMDHLSGRMDSLNQQQESRLGRFNTVLENRLTGQEERVTQMSGQITAGIRSLQEDNHRQLEEMRRTVDEKLHDTLNRRLSESFSLVNQRLEEVYKGLGEMRTLASGVGDLKKVLSNVKTRGIWGEVQLSGLLSQVLSPAQYEENCAVVPDSRERVEFAVRLPGRDQEKVLLPIDAKFPLEDYQRLLDSLDAGDRDSAAKARSGLEARLRTEAKRIASKYVCPPYSTDFAVMFLPLEGLYAEALQLPGLAEELQEKYHILPAGPTTLTALLTSLQVGFRTLAIEQRSGEVFKLLGAVKAEFSRYGELLETARKRIRSVDETLDLASRRSRAIETKLKNVESPQEVFISGDGDTGELPQELSDE